MVLFWLWHSITLLSWFVLLLREKKKKKNYIYHCYLLLPSIFTFPKFFTQIRFLRDAILCGKDKSPQNIIHPRINPFSIPPECFLSAGGIESGIWQWHKMNLPFKGQPRKMVKHTQTIHRQQPTNCLSVFNHFVGLALKRLKGAKT